MRFDAEVKQNTLRRLAFARRLLPPLPYAVLPMPESVASGHTHVYAMCC